MIATLRRFVDRHRIVEVVGPEAICARLGHVEDVTDMFDRSVHVSVRGCLRCQKTLDVNVHRGNYPLPLE